MKYIPYRKPRGWKGNSLTKGVKTGPMTVSFVDGKNPYSIGQVVLVRFKGSETVALVEGVNDQSLTVTMKNIDRKKVIRYNNVISVIETD